MVEEILLLSGNDIPFFPAKINIHPPTIREISLIGEENFFLGCQLLNFSKDVLNEEDRINLVDSDDFDILMSIVCAEGADAQQLRALMVLSLMFPDYSPEFQLDGIHLTLLEEEDEIKEIVLIDKEIFLAFQEIVSQVFGLKPEGEKEFKPQNEAARKIAEKLKKGRQRTAATKSTGSNKIAIFSRYISILAVGLRLDINVLLDNTVYQISITWI